MYYSTTSSTKTFSLLRLVLVNAQSGTLSLAYTIQDFHLVLGIHTYGSDVLINNFDSYQAVIDCETVWSNFEKGAIR
jgi:hypothetical protein